MAFVLDASVSAVWALADESHPLADRAMDQLTIEGAMVPSIWWFEVRNVLVTCERRGRLTADESSAFLKLIGEFPIGIDSEHDEDAILGFARKYQLSIYEAAYLDVAYRNRLPLATLDKALQTAAKAAGVPLLG
jgi:predicted nucleic acid-binding protein